MKKKTICVVFGNYLFDGRAGRQVKTLAEFSDVHIINLGTKNTNIYEYINSSYSHEVKLINVYHSFWSKISKHIHLLIFSFFYILREKPNIIISLNYFTVYLSLFKKILPNTFLIYDAYELLITNSYYNIRDNFWFILERLFIKNYNLIIQANSERAVLMLNFYSKKKIKNLLYLRNIPDIKSNSILLNDLKTISNKLGLSKDSKVILYQGDVSFDRNLNRFIDSLQHLPPNFVFLIVGDGPALNQIKQTYRQFIYDGRLICTGRVENHLINNYTRLGDIGIISYPFDGLNNIYCSPNKIFEYTQHGLPVLATSQPTLNSMISDFQIGKCIRKDADYSAVANTIKDLFNELNYYQSKLDFFVCSNTWENEVRQYKLILTDLFNEL